MNKKAGRCWGTWLIPQSEKCQRWSITRLRWWAARGLLRTEGMRPLRAKRRGEQGDGDAWGYSQELRPMKGMGERGFDSSLPRTFTSLSFPLSSPVGKTLLLKQSSRDLKYAKQFFGGKLGSGEVNRSFGINFNGAWISPCCNTVLKHFQDCAKHCLLDADLSITTVWSLVPSCEILHSFVINHILLSRGNNK